MAIGDIFSAFSIKVMPFIYIIFFIAANLISVNLVGFIIIYLFSVDNNDDKLDVHWSDSDGEWIILTKGLFLAEDIFAYRSLWICIKQKWNERDNIRLTK